MIPLDRLAASDIEYKADGRGFESRGSATASRAARAAWDTISRVCGAAEARCCGLELRLHLPRLFSLGTIGGPCSNGEVAGPETAGDPLEGIELRVVPARMAWAVQPGANRRGRAARLRRR